MRVDVDEVVDVDGRGGGRRESLVVAAVMTVVDLRDTARCNEFGGRTAIIL